MNKPLARRSFLKAMAAAPLVSKDAAAKDLMGLAGASVAPVPAMIMGVSPQSTKLLALFKAGMLPEWFLRGQRRVANYRNSIEPDVACLRSVSLSSKFRIQRDRVAQRALDNFERDILDQIASETFWGSPQPPSY